MSPTRSSSRFSSFEEWILAHDSALAELHATFGLNARSGPVMVGTPKGVDPRPKVEGLLEPRPAGNRQSPNKRSTGDVYIGLEDGSREITYTRPDQSVASGTVYTNCVRTQNLQAVQVKLGWTGEEWVLVQCFPARRGSEPAALQAKKVLDKAKMAKITILE